MTDYTGDLDYVTTKCALLNKAFIPPSLMFRDHHGRGRGRENVRGRRQGERIWRKLSPVPAASSIEPSTSESYTSASLSQMYPWNWWILRRTTSHSFWSYIHWGAHQAPIKSSRPLLSQRDLVRLKWLQNETKSPESWKVTDRDGGGGW